MIRSPQSNRFSFRQPVQPGSASPRFGGTLEELEGRKGQLLKITESKNIETAFQFLQEKVDVINQQPINGYQLLELMHQLGSRNRAFGRRFNTSLASGIPGGIGLLIGGIISVLSGMALPVVIGAAVPAAIGGGAAQLFSEHGRYFSEKNIQDLSANGSSFYNIRDFIRRLESLGLLEHKEVGSDTQQTYGYDERTIYRLTRNGLKILKAWQASGRQGLPLPESAQLESDPLTTDIHPHKVKTPVDAKTLRLNRLRVLITTPQETGLSGFALLQQIQRRSTGLYRRAINGLKRQTERPPSQALEKQLTRLLETGLIALRDGASQLTLSTVLLTDLGKAQLKQGNPTQNGALKDSDLSEMLQQEIDRLTEQRKNVQKQLEGLNTEEQQVAAELEKIRTSLNTHQAELLPLIAQQEAASDETEKQRLMLSVTTQKTQWERLEILGNLHEQWLNRFQATRQQLSLLYPQWQERIDRALTELLAAQTKIKLNRASQNLTALAQELDPRGAAAASPLLTQETQALLTRVELSDWSLSGLAEHVPHLTSEAQLSTTLLSTEVQITRTALEAALAQTERPADGQVFHKSV
jgi:DNA-binding PadR family transcriptional regulator